MSNRPPRSLIPLSALAGRVHELEILCHSCDREWAVEIAPEIAVRGPDAPVADVWHGLGADCPNRRSASIYQRCRLYAPGLVELG